MTEHHCTPRNVFFNFIFNIASVLIGIVLSLILISGLLLAALVFDHYNEISNHGLKPMIERVWCGPNSKCLTTPCQPVDTAVGK